MSETVNFDIDYKALIREKLLDAYEKNPLVLEKILQLKKRANLCEKNYFFNTSYLAGIIVSLCPELTNFIILSLELNHNYNIDHVFQVIGLNFDPRPELEKRAEARRLAKETTLVEDTKISGLLADDPEYRAVHEGLEEIRAQIRQQENSS